MDLSLKRQWISCFVKNVIGIYRHNNTHTIFNSYIGFWQIGLWREYAPSAVIQ